ncbi:MAG TPA: HAD family hydrolase [Candidatus Saccharimonadia bacterium]|jgi:HAD superfamily hydrolase (TIGR01549 family)|nr:HAD family hydrolase [Candidatus Saccharimonadia bacterium]
MIKEIWFDLNGTLTTQSPSFLAALEKIGYEAYAKATNRPIDDQLKTDYRAAYQEYGSKSAIFKALGMPKEFWATYFNSLDESKYYEPDERVYKTVDAIRIQVPIGLLSNSSPDRIERTLRTVAIDPAWFTHILTGHDVTEPKPHPQGFELMIARSQAKPRELAFVGDREKVDIVPAKKLGLTTVMVWSQSPTADYSFKDFTQLLSLV